MGLKPITPRPQWRPCSCRLCRLETAGRGCLVVTPHGVCYGCRRDLLHLRIEYREGVL